MDTDASGLIVPPTPEYQITNKEFQLCVDDKPGNAEITRNKKKILLSKDVFDAGYLSFASEKPTSSNFHTTCPAPNLILPSTRYPKTKKGFQFRTKSETKSTASSETPCDSGEDSVSEGGHYYDVADYEDHYVESVIKRRLYRLPSIHELINTFKGDVKTSVLKQLREVLDKKPTPKHVLEIADSIDLLRIMGASDPALDDVGRKARKGAKLYQDGLKRMNKGKDLLSSCLSDIS